jgi:hypothetical protein
MFRENEAWRPWHCGQVPACWAGIRIDSRPQLRPVSDTGTTSVPVSYS